MTALEIINKYIAFFEKRGHKRIANSPLVPENDPTTLFTSSGMQPLVPYLLGEKHPMGKRLVNVQNSFRAQDIDEVGDNRHTTFFRMLGNWSLGEYFKKEQIEWIFDFFTKELNLDSTKLYVTIFKGFGKSAPKDTESERIWKEQFLGVSKDFYNIGINEITVNENPEKGIKKTDRIFYYDVEKNWWSRSGTPDKMPIGEPGGPDTEVFYDFGEGNKFHEKSVFKDVPCHPNCDCGRFLEIGNSVFMEFAKNTDGFLKPLVQKNVDFGGGLERLLAAAENESDIFKTSLYSESIKTLEILTKTDLNYNKNPKPYRVIADHLTASIFMVSDGVIPENKGRGYILRRLIRRAMINARKLGMSGDEWLSNVSPILEATHNIDHSLKMDVADINSIITHEVDKFRKTIEGGIRELKKIFGRAIGGVDPEDPKNTIISNNVIRVDGREIFRIYETYGLPPEIAQEIMTEWGLAFDGQTMNECNEAMRMHQQASRVASAGMFKGGLADNSEKTIMGHTTTHLLHKILRDMFGEKLHQAGSNITSERLRFDFAFDRNLTPEELKKIEETVNQKIKDNLPVSFEILPLEKAKESNAIGIFNEKYSDKVKVYSVGNYSKEICGGPHVAFTSEIKSFKIIKEENIGKGNRRIYAKIG